MSRRKITLVVDAPDEISNPTVLHSIVMLLATVQHERRLPADDHQRYLAQLGGKITAQSVSDYPFPRNKRGKT